MNLSFSKIKKNIKFNQRKKKQILHASRTIFWFTTGAFLTLFFIMFFGFFIYQKIYDGKIFPGVFINNLDFGGKTKNQVRDFFDYKNSLIANTNFSLTSIDQIATVSAKEIDFGFDEDLSSEQAYTIGRSGNFISDLSILLQSYFMGTKLPAAYTLNQDKLNLKIKPISNQINKEPVNALFKFENGRVLAFKPSKNGLKVDIESLNQKLIAYAFNVLTSEKNQTIAIKIPIIILEPETTTEKANNLGIKELIGVGNSSFYHSIPGRIHNVNLATTRINGVLIAPGEVFSFVKTLGDVSAFTGYQQAYVIQNGKTVLGDGGGVCQVSTTFFRALLDAGLPIIERHPHAYRVGYYEQDSPPGLDATVFVPTVDLKFRNDTGNYILIQSEIDLNNLALTFYLYGTKDGRKVTMTTPIITNQSPPPPTIYQDDPTLPKGETKQTDFAAWGANVNFTRTVEKNNKIIISDKFVSNYRPWQATYLVGTKE